MTKYEIKEVNCETGEEVIREMTVAEIAQREKDIAESEAIKTKTNEFNAARISALAKLAALGLTPEELNAIS